MSDVYSRRRLEIHGVSMGVLKNHPPVDDLNGYESLHFNNSAGASRKFSVTSETLSCSTNCSSLSSVDDDEFEKASAQTIQNLFDDIDMLLYDDVKSPNKLMDEECRDWMDHYPHFRVIGKQIIPEEDVGFQIVNIEKEKSSLSLTDEEAADNHKLTVQGKQMDIYIPPTANETITKDYSLDFGLHSQEEIIIQDGEYEELIAVDHGNIQSKYNGEAHLVYTLDNDGVIFKENLLDMLEDKIWHEVVSWMRPLITEYIHHVHSSSFHLSARTAPPAIPANFSSKNVEQPNMRLATAPPRSSMRSDVNGILTVTSKMLQYKQDKLNSSLPNNPLALARKNPLKYIYGENTVSSTSNRLLQNRRIPTAVRLTPLNHSIKKPLDEMKNDNWRKNSVASRPLTSKRPSPPGRVSSSYWNRNITLPPIQQPESYCDSTKTMIRPSKYRHEKLTKIHMELPTSLSEDHHKDQNDVMAKSPDDKNCESPELFGTTNAVNGASLSKSNNFKIHVPSNSADSSQTEESSPGSLNNQWELVQTKEIDALNEESVHTVEPFVTWLLTQVQSNACKASDSVEHNGSSS